MVSYSAGNISSAESAELVAALAGGTGDERSTFYPGVGFRHILTVRDGEELVATTFTPPHDIAEQPVDAAVPTGPGAALRLDLMERSKAVLEGHPVNERRVAGRQAARHADMALLAGHAPGRMPAFAELYGGRRAALTSPVDLLKGLPCRPGWTTCLSRASRTVPTTTTRVR